MLKNFGAVVAVLIAFSGASAGEAVAPVGAGYDEYIPETRGCYWYRQRQFCSRYCYTEVDGRRFCREREREAYPQAPVRDNVTGWEVVPSQPMKLGTGPVR